MSESDQSTERSGSSRPEFAYHFWSFAHFCLARVVLSPLLLFLLIYEVIGALTVVAGAGLIAGGIYGISVTSGRSVLMWALLALGIVLPLIYYKLQVDGQQLWWDRVVGLTEKWDQDRLRHRDKAEIDTESQE